ncbi:MAG: archaetidylserine decarboxylase [gamma proteobacterium symbiont of Bathyaustriella thionipta]|nr:archaetidylserine decarboxylase [gamma proteobacterium symbiont of Bathyaustriella thionipta]
MSLIVDKLFALLQFVLPQHLLSRGVYWLARRKAGSVLHFVIRRFVAIYRVDMQQAAEPDIGRYATFNQFFTRALKDGARPLANPDEIASPVDGGVCQLGAISDSGQFNAKGHFFNLSDLLGHDTEWEQAFKQGSFCTLYLSPRDYHRVHCPLAAKLRKTSYLPGRLFSVSPSTTRAIDNLFSRNERLICFFDTQAGPMALIFVGALFVSGIETVWGGEMTPTSEKVIKRLSWNKEEAPPFAAGEELGRFNMGSTVILLFSKDAIKLRDELAPGKPVVMGQAIADITLPAE